MRLGHDIQSCMVVHPPPPPSPVKTYVWKEKTPSSDRVPPKSPLQKSNAQNPPSEGGASYNDPPF